jgi:poly(ADP-ribose) glycohydrolase
MIHAWHHKFSNMVSICTDYVLIFKILQGSNTKDNFASISSDEYIGVSTGNWGCGAFGGNPEIKSMIQWIAASQV